MKPPKTTPITIRLTFRVEGLWWNCYLAPPNSMEGAIKLGSILMSAVEDSAECKQLFMLAIQAAFDAFARSELGVIPAWSEPTIGPENERAGRA